MRKITFSYSGNPKDSKLMEVRFILGDTNEDEFFLTDEEILFLLDEANENVMKASAKGAKSIYSTFAKGVDYRLGDFSENLSQRAGAYKELYKELEWKANMFVAPFAGGISKAQKKVQEKDSDRVEPSFKKGLFDYDEEDERLKDRRR